jgi:hypothetical protein
VCARAFKRGASADDAPSVLELVHRGAGNVVAVFDRRILIFARDRPLTSAALDAIEAVAPRITTLLGDARPGGVLALIPGDAGLSSSELLTRQRRFFAGRSPHVWVAFCVTGDSAQTLMVRAAARMFLPGHDHLVVHSDLQRALRWLSERVAIPATVLDEAVRVVEGSCSGL